MITRQVLLAIIILAQATPAWAQASELVGVFSQYGLAGLIILFMGWAVLKLFNLYTSVQEKRIDLGERVLDALNANTQALDALKDSLKDRRRS